MARLAALIFSGGYEVGQRLPPERSLADKWMLSRPVVHDAVVEMQRTGMVRIVPRHGVYVADFVTLGSSNLLTAMIAHAGNDGSPVYVRSLVEIHNMLQCESAHLAARHRTADNLRQLYDLVEEIQPGLTVRQKAENLYRFNQLTALASHNIILPVLVNSIRDAYLKYGSLFIEMFPGAEMNTHIQASCLGITRAIEAGDSIAARQAAHAFFSQATDLFLGVYFQQASGPG